MQAGLWSKVQDFFAELRAAFDAAIEQDRQQRDAVYATIRDTRVRWTQARRYHSAQERRRRAEWQQVMEGRRR